MSNTRIADHSSVRLTVVSLIVILTGAAVFAVAVTKQALVLEFAWLMMVAMALFAGPISGTLYIPGVKAKITFGDLITVTCAALFGPNAAIIAAVADGAGTSLRMTSSPRKLAYNMAMSAVSMAGASFTTVALFPQFGNRTTEMPVFELAAALGVFTGCYFVLSTSVVAFYLAFPGRKSVFGFWRENFLWASVSYVASGGSAFGACLLVGKFGYYSFLIPVGLTVMVFLFYRTYFQKVESANQRADQYEEQLRQAQKMEAIGRLAGGVAHDFNNLLTAILGYSELLLAGFKDDDPLRNNVEEIKKAGERAASLTRQLLAFSRRQMFQAKVLDINVVVADLHKMLVRLIGEDIGLVTINGPELGRVKADPGQIEQVLMNLALNARDAMPDGGRLVIETANVTVNKSDAIGLKPGNYIKLSVIDSGCGILPENLPRIFEPFFTTKEQGKGTGLGLSTVYGIVTQSGGNILVNSESGRGATFEIYLPRIDEPHPEIEPIAAAVEPARSAEVILLVEDEDVVRRLVCEVVKRSGYSVLEAANGIEALKVSEKHDGPIHLMVTDVVMPQMGGRELAERMALVRPETSVLYVSGYTDDAIVRHRVLDAGLDFLQKPFSPDALVQKIREMLDRTHPVFDGPTTKARAQATIN